MEVTLGISALPNCPMTHVGIEPTKPQYRPEWASNVPNEPKKARYLAG